MKDLKFPIKIEFRISTLSNDFTAYDSSGQVLCYSKQKLFKLKEHVDIFSDQSQAERIYTINANKWLDFSTTYVMKTDLGDEIGRIARKGWSSLWKANYEIFDQYRQPDVTIREENPWSKVMDSMLGEIPIVGMLTGYMFNPTYIAKRPDESEVVRIRKDKSMWGRRFTIDQLDDFEEGEEERILLGVIMMVLLERRRG